MDDQFLTYPQAAEFLGLKLNTLYAMVANKRIPHVRLGPRLVRFSLAALRQWLREREVTPESPVVPGIQS